MNATQVMIGMTLLRVILPFSLLLLVGEWAARSRPGAPRGR
jgi:hypothetical protein